MARGADRLHLVARALHDLGTHALLVGHGERVALQPQALAVAVMRPVMDPERHIAIGSPGGMGGRRVCLRQHSHGFGPSDGSLSTRLRETGESPSSPMNLCISSSCLLAMPSQGDGWM